MKTELYAIRDDKLGYFNTPVKMMNDAAAIREFGDLVTRDKESPFYVHSADFSIWYIGEFDDSTGLFVDNDKRELARGSDFAKENK